MHYNPLLIINHIHILGPKTEAFPCLVHKWSLILFALKNGLKYKIYRGATASNGAHMVHGKYWNSFFEEFFKKVNRIFEMAKPNKAD